MSVGLDAKKQYLQIRKATCVTEKRITLICFTRAYLNDTSRIKIRKGGAMIAPPLVCRIKCQCRLHKWAPEWHFLYEGDT